MSMTLVTLSIVNGRTRVIQCTCTFWYNRHCLRVWNSYPHFSTPVQTRPLRVIILIVFRHRRVVFLIEFYSFDSYASVMCLSIFFFILHLFYSYCYYSKNYNYCIVTTCVSFRKRFNYCFISCRGRRINLLEHYYQFKFTFQSYARVLTLVRFSYIGVIRSFLLKLFNGCKHVVLRLSCLSETYLCFIFVR